jgi:DNA-binding LacI/PurR family transcriptional regulator
MKIGLRQVAEQAGVSVSTVSRALNGQARVDPKTRERIRVAMETLNYRAYPSAEELAPKPTRLLGFLMPEEMQVLGLDNSVYGSVINAVRAAAGQAGYGLTIATYTNGPDNITVGDRLLAQKSLDGVLLYRTRLSDESFERFRDLGLLFVVIGRLFDRDPFHCVGVDNRQCGHIAIRHLLSLGHQRIAFVNGPRNIAPSQQRLEGFRQGMREAHVAPREEWLVECNYDPTLAFEIARGLMKSTERPTAIIAANDRVAWAILRAVQEQGLNVPADVSVIGFDDATESAHVTPPLTTISLEWKQMAEIATQMLVEVLRRKIIRQVYIALEPKLVVRQSTATPGR